MKNPNMWQEISSLKVYKYFKMAYQNSSYCCRRKTKALQNLFPSLHFWRCLLVLWTIIIMIKKKTQNPSQWGCFWLRPFSVTLPVKREAGSDPGAAGETQGHMWSDGSSKQLAKQTQTGHTHSLSLSPHQLDTRHHTMKLTQYKTSI